MEPELRITFTKRRDGSVAVRFTRRDGTETWQHHKGKNGRFFVLHDLAHYAVETELGVRLGFYGLIADGWNVTDFGSPWPRGPLPANAEPVELIIGLLDTERMGGERWTAEEFNFQAALYFEEHGQTATLDLTDDALNNVRKRVREIRSAWEDVAADGNLVLTFSRDA